MNPTVNGGSSNGNSSPVPGPAHPQANREFTSRSAPYLTRRQILAATALADDMTPTKVCEKYDIKERTLFNWRKLPLFDQEVTRLREAKDKAIERAWLGRRSKRIELVEQGVKATLVVQQARQRLAESDPELLAQGGSSGLVIRTGTHAIERVIQKADGTQEVVKFSMPKFEFDYSMLSERRAAIRQIAEEVGDLKGDAGVNVGTLILTLGDVFAKL